jgi:hypothetical protein
MPVLPSERRLFNKNNGVASFPGKFRIWQPQSMPIAKTGTAGFAKIISARRFAA